MIEGYGLSHLLRFICGCSRVGEGEGKGCTLERKCLSACVSFISAKRHVIKIVWFLSSCACFESND